MLTFRFWKLLTLRRLQLTLKSSSETERQSKRDYFLTH